ncbi:undecaprenyl-diphosphate phosphatase [Marinilabiliaceae bacterium ANBcel2]|nr:undecaprenyl-diphosphate phosphatase [Marinilabiliaceae bacterium ANBcel2]
MTIIEALILGLIQGLTEFLPVSSSGHLEIGRELLGVEATDNLRFSVVVHGATVLSTLVVFRDDIAKLLTGLFKFEWNEETKYIAKIAVSMIPIAIVGLFFKEHVEAVFATENILLLVGLMLLITATLLTLAYIKKGGDKDISYKHALIIGIAQVFAVMPGISRSGATIATGLMLGNKRSEMAKFSFLMVLVPILGENFLDLLKMSSTTEAAATAGISGVALLSGFITAFIAGLFACKWMIRIVKQGKLIWFAIYCAIIAAISITGSFI